ncbi:MAG: hypothetical protein Q8P12_05495 [bacterium]|nr:hypothetical protein [bacterium]MDZ4346777.1 hypothetical protein [Candidatus Binatia bacterium]
MDQWEREEEDLESQLTEGIIDQKEFNKEIQDLCRSRREAAYESAKEAYNRELENW